MLSLSFRVYVYFEKRSGQPNRHSADDYVIGLLRLYSRCWTSIQSEDFGRVVADSINHASIQAPLVGKKENFVSSLSLRRAWPALFSDGSAARYRVFMCTFLRTQPGHVNGMKTLGKKEGSLLSRGIPMYSNGSL